jgi:hypothetical protein
MLNLQLSYNYNFPIGFRMDCPPECPDTVYRLMLQCWQWSPSDRPRFQDLHSNLSAQQPSDDQAQNTAASRFRPPPGAASQLAQAAASIAQQREARRGEFARPEITKASRTSPLLVNARICSVKAMDKCIYYIYKDFQRFLTISVF